MCGRYSLTDPVEALNRLFGLGAPAVALPRFNIAPSQMAPVVRRNKDKRREVALLQWGLVPSWAKDPAIGNGMINARAETAAEKPDFRDAVRSRRCLVPSDGFYEWRTGPGGKQPYRICIDDGAPFAMAGLWEQWTAPQGKTLETFAMLTTAASEQIAHIHHRMPVIVTPDEYDGWLDATHRLQPEAFAARPTAGLRAYPVSTHVNRPANDDASCLVPIDRPADRQPPRQGELF